MCRWGGCRRRTGKKDEDGGGTDHGGKCVMCPSSAPPRPSRTMTDHLACNRTRSQPLCICARGDCPCPDHHRLSVDKGPRGDAPEPRGPDLSCNTATPGCRSTAAGARGPMGPLGVTQRILLYAGPGEAACAWTRAPATDRQARLLRVANARCCRSRKRVGRWLRRPATWGAADALCARRAM